LIQAQVQAICILRKKEFYKTCKLSVEKLLIKISSFSHLAIVSFLNNHGFSKLFKLYLTGEEEQDTEKDAE